MKKFLIAVGLVLICASNASAQLATSNAKLAWDQNDPVPLTLVQAAIVKFYVDSAAPITVVANCTGLTLPYVCVVPFSAITLNGQPLTSGNHTIMATISNEAGESQTSLPFAFVFVKVLSPPGNMRIVP